MVFNPASLAPGYIVANFFRTKAATAGALFVSTGGNMTSAGREADAVRLEGSKRRLRRLRICDTLAQAQTWAVITTMIVGITGGLGCGKSTVAGAFERRGW